ncbi:MAG TPA: TadE family protein [Actinospica sp.]|nr:TadE family protein [Actinospica sp.]
MRKSRRERNESGATAIEFVVLTPILFLLMFGSVQIGLALFARHVAVSAAQEGARKARETAVSKSVDWQTVAPQAASDWVVQLLGSMVQGTPTANPLDPVPLGNPHPEVGVSVQFDVASVIPFWTFTVSSQSVGPVECFYEPNGHCNGY